MVNIKDELKSLKNVTSLCKRKAVGCCILPYHHRAVYAVNGPVGGDCNGELASCGCMHAEIKALLCYELRTPAIMLCTYSPCTNCANAIIASKCIDTLFYEILTEHDKRGLDFLRWHMDVFSLKDIEDGKADEWLSNHFS